MKKSFTFFLFLLFTSLIFEISAQVYANHAATGANNGTSWENAYTNLQDALTNADDDDEIRVAQGTYLPGNTPTATFLIDKNLHLLGGYDASTGSRDTELYETILSGDVNGDDIPDDFTMNRSDNVETVVTVRNNVSEVAVLDGFTISNGHADGTISTQETRGGGLYATKPVIVQNCLFTRNFAGLSGGGAYLFAGSSTDGVTMEVNNCKFENNRAGANEGGGGLFLDTWGQNSTFIVTNCAFNENGAALFGGGARVWAREASNNANIVIDDCTFQQNTTSNGGGGLDVSPDGSNVTFTMTNSNFYGNTTSNGGGLSSYLHGTDITYTITNSGFFGNTASEWGGGAVIHGNAGSDGSSGNVTVSDCIFEDNSAAHGGGIYTLVNGNDAVIEIINTIFKENSTAPVLTGWDSGGAGFCCFIGEEVEKTNITLDQCTFENNTTAGVGGGVSFINQGIFTTSKVTNCSFAGNVSIFHGGGLRFGSGETANHATMVVDSCTFSQNHNEMWTGGGLRALLLGANNNLTLSNSDFTENSAGFSGAGAAIYGFTDSSSGNVNVFNNTFDSNVSQSDAGLSIGSGTDAGYFEYTISECGFFENNATFSGGGLGLFSERPAKFLVEYCQIEGNSSDSQDGGLFVSTTHPDMNALIRNCTLVDNSALFAAAIGALPFSEDPADFMITSEADIVFENCLVTGNSGTGGSIGLKQTGNVQFHNCTIAENPAGGIVLDSASVVTLKNTILYNPGFVEYQDLTGTSSVHSLGGNLLSDNSLPMPHENDLAEENPLFVGMNDFHLSDNSPAVDQGVDYGNLPEFDLDGNPRVVGCVDIGAYENPNSTNPPCLTNTGEVLANSLLEIFPNPATDFLNVQLHEEFSRPVEVSLFDTQGRLVRRQIVYSNQPFDVRNLVGGLYLIKARVGEESFSGRFVKQ